MYVRGGQGDDARYLEYVYAPSPMYQYAMFKNRGISFWGETYYDCNGGLIHSNQDITFHPSGKGMRFNQVAQITASGTIQYGRYNQYIAPHIIDNLDGTDNDGMAPAPCPDAIHYSTTDGVELVPGPFRYWKLNANGTKSLTWKWYGGWVANAWGTNNKVPYILRGQETYFRGRQHGETTASSSGYYTNEGATYNMYTSDGDITSDADTWSDSTDKPIIERFYMADNDSSFEHETDDRYYYAGDVHIRPYLNKAGEENERAWFQLPGALPQEYTWNKYHNYANVGTENPVTFYITEPCIYGAYGCNFDPVGDPDKENGWRYLKKDADGNVCADDDCYHDEKGNYGSDYVKAQDYTIGGLPYYDFYNPSLSDSNNEFFGDGNYTYGDDANDPSLWKTRAFNSEKQKAAFLSYLTTLDNQGLSGMLDSGIEKKKPFLGNLFDTDTEDSVYKTKAQANGMQWYISDSSSAADAAALLNGDLAEGDEFAEAVTFYNWKTNQPITVVEIDIEKMIDKGKEPANGIIYSDYPVLLRNAENLPGTNEAGKRAVFTLISEESVYLMGNYNYDPADPDDANNNWKISNISTKKTVYTLSDQFNFPKSGRNPDGCPAGGCAADLPNWDIYPNYPFVGTPVVKDAEGTITQYLDPATHGECSVITNPDTCIWANGAAVLDTESGVYKLYSGMSTEIRNWIEARKDTYQNNHLTAVANTLPNQVCEAGAEECTYTYNSLFLTPHGFDGDSSLEDWSYDHDSDPNTNAVKAVKNVTGSFIDFYDQYDENYDDEYYTALGAEENTWDYWRQGTAYENTLSQKPTDPINSGYIKNNSGRQSPSINRAYDARFPTVRSSNSGAVLGFTGTNSWRLIDEAYFGQNTQ